VESVAKVADVGPARATGAQKTVDLATFKDAMSRFPSGVVVVTTRDSKGKPWGFTASSFSSVSLDPPLVLVPLAKTAECYQAFNSAEWFAISVLSAEDEVTAARFAKRGADKFAGMNVETDEHGSPLLPSAVATLTCQRFNVHDCGDHAVIVGRVTMAGLGSDDSPMVYSSRRFGRFVGAPRTVPTPHVASPVRHCVRCGSGVVTGVPEGDTVARHICRRCGNIHYVNPTVVVGCVAETADGRILMCRRRIRPRRGFWTFPSGFLECGESGGEGARREVLEETRAQVHIEGLLCVFDVPQMSEVHLVYRGTLRSLTLGPTEESSEVTLMTEAEIPWDELAFTSIGESLRRYFEDRRQKQRVVHTLDLRMAPPGENRDELAPSVCGASR
jgi:flavin reductase (DIM6/NTAB) family NADH-FMN oxidoreductase RutF/ADP-ribose pyrophosphatase YjhB (NUDIX family)